MIVALISLVLVLLLLCFLVWFSINTVFQVYSSFRGSPYVPTEDRNIGSILRAAGVKRGMKMLELGCGDGRVLISAVRDYGVVGYGVDINPWILRKARKNASDLSSDQITFEVRDIADIDVSNFDVVYLFLLPKFLDTYAERWLKTARKNTLFISHAFTIQKFKKYLLKTIPGTPYDTYCYRVK